MSKLSAIGIPWVEKYRPNTIQDVSHQEPVKRMLTQVIKQGNMPHCLFYGPPGTGKTSVALALCKQLFGYSFLLTFLRQETWKRRVLELNASDDRGIAVVRETVKGWSRTMVGVSVGSDAPDWKVVILDEADMMTSDAQSALRRIMEDNARNTRFIIICNYLSRIIDPISSRCARYRFEPISRESQLTRLRIIAEAELLQVTNEAFEYLLQISNGDLRKGITILQAASLLATEENEIGTDTICDAAAFPPPSVASNLVENPNNDTLQQMISDSWDVNQIMRQMLKLIIATNKFNDLAKARILAVLAEAQFRLTQGASETIQMRLVLSTIKQEKS